MCVSFRNVYVVSADDWWPSSSVLSVQDLLKSLPKEHGDVFQDVAERNVHCLLDLQLFSVKSRTSKAGTVCTVHTEKENPDHFWLSSLHYK